MHRIINNSMLAEGLEVGRYDWSGKNIAYAFVDNKRPVSPNGRNIDYRFDMRHWIDNGHSFEIQEAMADVFSGNANWRTLNDDQKARACWRYIRTFSYMKDERDYWQLPAETLRLRSGDCEDLSFLLASLLLGSGISPYHIRVVFGCVTWETNPEAGAPTTPDPIRPGGLHALEGNKAQGPHVWVVYKNLGGTWSLLETTTGRGRPIPSIWFAMDDYANPSRLPFYKPWMCLNNDLAWSIALQDCQGDEAMITAAATATLPPITLLDRDQYLELLKQGALFI